MQNNHVSFFLSCDNVGQQPACSVPSKPTEAPEWDGMPPPPKRTPKRAPSPPGGTPKRPRTSPGPCRTHRAGGRGDTARLLPLTTPPSLARLKFGQSPSPRVEQGKKSPGSVGKRSPACVPGGGSASLPSSPTVMKRNHKGETPLHLAAIKVSRCHGSGFSLTERNKNNWTEHYNGKCIFFSFCSVNECDWPLICLLITRTQVPFFV